MKNLTTKMMLSVAIVFASLTVVKAQSYNDNNPNNQSAYQDQYTQQPPAQQNQQYVQTQPQGYYYYPDANVYYNPTCNNYIYYNGASWLTVGILPYNIRLGGLPRMMVYYRGPQVWLDNNIHRNYYANNYGRRPQVVAYNNYRGGGFARGGYYGGGFNRGGGYARGGGFSRGGGFGHHR